MHSIPLIRIGIIIIAATVGCAAPRKQATVVPPPTTRPIVTAGPMLDISRGGAGLPLEDATVLRSSDDLQNGIQKAFERRMTFSQAPARIVVGGDNLRALDHLSIDISNAVVKDEYRPAQNKKPGRAEPAIAVKQFEYRAWPVSYQKLPTYWQMTATDAKFGLIRDPSGRQTLVLTDAREGTFNFSLPLADIKKPRIVTAGPTTARSNVNLQDVDLQFTSDNPHMLAIQLQMKATFLLVPMTFRLRARADVDQWCNVKVSGLSCEGLDPGGALVATFVSGMIQKYNGQLVTIARWPEDRIQLTDIQFKVDDSLHITGTFAGKQ